MSLTVQSKKALAVTAFVAAVACAVGLAPAFASKAASIAPQAMIEVANPAAGCGSSAAAPEVLLLQVEEGGACWADGAEGASAQPDSDRPKLGYCQCGCGIRCASSADCGGDPCRPFITCC
jgi:hypothetical protein